MSYSSEFHDGGGSRRSALPSLLLLLVMMLLAASYLGFRPRLAMYMHTIRWLRELLLMTLGG